MELNAKEHKIVIVSCQEAITINHPLLSTLYRTKGYRKDILVRLVNLGYLIPSKNGLVATEFGKKIISENVNFPRKCGADLKFSNILY